MMYHGRTLEDLEKSSLLREEEKGLPIGFNSLQRKINPIGTRRRRGKSSETCSGRIGGHARSQWPPGVTGGKWEKKGSHLLDYLYPFLRLLAGRVSLQAPTKGRRGGGVEPIDRGEKKKQGRRDQGRSEIKNISEQRRNSS